MSVQVGSDDLVEDPAYTTTPTIENTAEAADVIAAPTGRET